MNTAAKLFAAMCTHPLDWHLRDLQTVARRSGIAWHQEGSHCVFVDPNGQILSVPAHRPIKAAYVKRFVTLVREQKTWHT